MARPRKRKASTSASSTSNKRVTRSTKKIPKTFFDLPPEIRNAIYYLALPESTPIEVKKQYGGSPLTFANKAVRSECLSVYLASNTFNIDNIDIQTWANAVGVNNLFAYMSRIFFQVNARWEWPVCDLESFYGSLNVDLSLEPQGDAHRIIITYGLPGTPRDDEEYGNLMLVFRGAGSGRFGQRIDRSAQLRQITQSVSKSTSDMTFADLIKLRSKMTGTGQYYFTYIVRDTLDEDAARTSWVPIIIEPTGGLRPRRDLRNLCTGNFVTNDGERQFSGSICHNVLFREMPDRDGDGTWSKSSRKQKPKKAQRGFG